MNPSLSNGIVFLGVYVLIGILGSLYVLGQQTDNMEKKGWPGLLSRLVRSEACCGG